MASLKEMVRGLLQLRFLFIRCSQPTCVPPTYRRLLLWGMHLAKQSGRRKIALLMDDPLALLDLLESFSSSK